MSATGPPATVHQSLLSYTVTLKWYDQYLQEVMSEIEERKLFLDLNVD